MADRPIIMPVEPQEKRAERVRRITAFLFRLDAGKPWELLVRPFKKERTQRQNNALFGVAYRTLGNFLGYTEPELHDVMLRLYFGEVHYEVMGVRRVKPRRTTTTNEAGEREVLSREKLSEYYDFIVRTAAEQGCYIDDPNPMLRTRAA